MIKDESGSIPKDDVATKVIKIEGRINCIKEEEKGLVLLTLKDKDDEVIREVKFPFVKNNLALDALNSCLLNQNVKYTDFDKHWCYTQMDIGSSNNYELEILEGPLKGKIYRAEEIH